MPNTQLRLVVQAVVTATQRMRSMGSILSSNSANNMHVEEKMEFPSPELSQNKAFDGEVSLNCHMKNIRFDTS